MNGLELLRSDHERLRRIFDRYERLDTRAHRRRRALLDDLRAELETHRRLEEEFLFPAIAREPGFGQEIDEAREELGVIQAICEDLGEIGPEDPRAPAKVTVLRENVEHHIAEEEREIFPRFASVVPPGVLDEIGVRMAARREALRGSLV